MKNLIIQFEEDEKKGRAFITDATTTLAEMTFNKTSPNFIIIDHTEISDTLRGNGVGRKLLDKIVEWTREKNIKILPLCPFAKSVFQKDKTIQDVLKGTPNP